MVNLQSKKIKTKTVVVETQLAGLNQVFNAEYSILNIWYQIIIILTNSNISLYSAGYEMLGKRRNTLTAEKLLCNSGARFKFQMLISRCERNNKGTHGWEFRKINFFNIFLLLPTLGWSFPL